MVKFEGNTLIVTQGDTANILTTLTGITYASGDMGELTFAGKDGIVLVRKTASISNSSLSFALAHADTKDIPEGDYEWELRIVTGATVSDGKIVSGTDWISPYEKPQPLRINRSHSN